MSLLNIFAPRFSKRRLFLKVLQDFSHAPATSLGRLAAENFHNAKVCAQCVIHCPICGARAGMTYDFPNVHLRRAHGIGLLRETLACRSCGGTMRDRQMATGILQIVAKKLSQIELDLNAFRARPKGRIEILDTDSFSAISKVLRGLPGYVHSEYRADLPNGEALPGGSINVNLLDIPYAENHFDLIMTSDVMEHVADDDRAHREIYRCLASSGTYVFTVPYDPCLYGTRVLTEPTDNPMSHFILQRQVHGDPHSSSGIIAHRIYGRHFIVELEAMGFQVQFQDISNPAQGIFGGDLFLASKSV